MEVTHLKATCFLAHLSMSHPEGQPPPCIGLPKTTWMESHGSGVGSSIRHPPRYAGCLGVSWLVGTLLHPHLTTASHSVWPSPGSSFPLVKTSILSGQGLL